MKKRLLVSIVLLACAYVAPIWLTLTLCFAFLFVFRNFYEVLIITLVIDSISGSLLHTYGYSLVAMICVFCVEYFKTFLRD